MSPMGKKMRTSSFGETQRKTKGLTQLYIVNEGIHHVFPSTYTVSVSPTIEFNAFIHHFLFNLIDVFLCHKLLYYSTIFR